MSLMEAATHVQVDLNWTPLKPKHATWIVQSWDDISSEDIMTAWHTTGYTDYC